MQDLVIDAVAEEYRLTSEQVTEIFDLFEKGVTVPFLIHYRKDLVGSLSYDDLKALQERKRDLRKLDKRKREVLKKLRERDLLTQDLEDAVMSATTLRAVNDIFLPYRPKKHSKSVQAVALGLEPLARKMLTQEVQADTLQQAAQAYVDEAKGLPDVPSVLKNCAYIICDWIAEERTLRETQRDILRKQGRITSRKSKQKLPDRLSREFRDYFEFEDSVQSLHPYRMLLILRGAKMRVLEYGYLAPLAAMADAAADLYLEGGRQRLHTVVQSRPEGPISETLYVSMKGEKGKRGDHGYDDTDESLSFPDVPERVPLHELLVLCIEWSLQNILAPVLLRELDREMSDKAETHAINMFKRNLRSILMQQPLPGKRVLAISPGYRTGCKVAALDEKGQPLETTTVFPHTPQNEIEAAKAKLTEMVTQHNMEVVAIGDGTANRETEALISQIIEEKLPELRYTIVSETGLQSYVSSKLAKQELPGLPQAIKGAISIGRRLQDPIAELVKLEPKVLCSSPYVQNVSGRRLKDSLNDVVEQCVCEIGVDANRAELNMLRNISGLNGNRARALLAKRAQIEQFTSRAQLTEVEGIDEDVYKQCAGFVRIAASEKYYDHTRIHPEHYEIADSICEEIEVDPAKLDTSEEREKVEAVRKQVNLTALEEKHGVHYLTIRDIIAQLAEGWVDPRGEWSAPVLRKSQLKLEEIEAGQTLRGVVRNIVDFGVFVDVGVNEDGLIHVSELSDGYVHSPYEVVSTGDILDVRVIKVDLERNRIALSLRKGDRTRPSRRPPKRTPRAEQTRRRPSRSEGSPKTPTRREAPTQQEPQKAGPIQVTQSTTGTKSRRFQKAARQPGEAGEEAAERETGAEGEGREERQQKGKPEKVEGLIDMVQFGKLEKRGESEK